MHLRRLLCTRAAALGLATALCGGAHGTSPGEAEAATDSWLRQRLLQPAGANRDAGDAAFSELQRSALLQAVASAPATALLSPATLRELLPTLRLHRALGEGLLIDHRPADALVPPWLLEALARRVAALSLPAGPAPPLRGGEWAGTLGEPDRQDPRRPAVWAGPAVRDGVAHYRTENGGTRVRLSMGDAGLLHGLARARGAALRVALDAGARPLRWDEPLPLKLSLALPVWLATPTELLPATLTELRSGDACHGGYLELALAGVRQPPVWAVLFLPDEATARAARVRRLPAAPSRPDEPPSPATQVSRLEVAWPDHALPALHLVAKRFGDVWGSHAEPADAKPGEYRRLSGAGSPACAPRPPVP